MPADISSRTSTNHIRLMLFAALAALVLGLGFLASAGATSAQTDTQKQALKPIPLNSTVATTANVNLRDQPDIKSTVLTVIPVNSKLPVLGGPFYGEWYWTVYSGKWGFVSGTLITQVDASYTPMPAGTQTPATATPPVKTTVTVPVSQTATVTATTVPTLPNYSGLMLAEMTVSGNVRSGPGLDQKIVKGWWPGRRVLLYQAVKDKKGDTWYRVSEAPEPPLWVHSSLVDNVAPVKFEPARFKGKWVNVNLSQQIVTAYEDGTPVKVTLASTGTAKNPTTVGTWRIYWRLPKQDMKGGNLASADYYDLKDVPYPQYFHTSGEALHGTYWHDDFGHPHSHGCVNLSTPMSEWFYGWDNIGTIVYVHN